MEAWTLPVLFRELQSEPTEATGQLRVTGHGLQTANVCHFTHDSVGGYTVNQD